MTEVQDEAPVETGEQGGDPRILVRSFGAETTMADDRTLEVRVVPFDQVATVADPPDFRPYREQFLPRVFDRNERAPNRILLRAGFGHDGLDKNGNRKPGLGGVVGHGAELLSRDDGYIARFKMHSGSEADTARELVADNVMTGVSAEFVPIKNNRTGDGILQRVKAHLDSVLLTYKPAYSKAQVLAMREETVDLEMMPPPINKQLLERCAELGIALPASMVLARDGGSLASKLNGLIEASSLVRAELIASMASAAGIDAHTVDQILNGGISCPPAERLTGFAKALGVSSQSLMDAAKADGCNYEM